MVREMRAAALLLSARFGAGSPDTAIAQGKPVSVPAD